MRVLALLEDPDGPSARLRFEPFARRLAAAGDAIERRALQGSGPCRWRELHAARGFDVVYLQRRLLQPWESAWLRARARRLVVDVDDALWRRDHPPFESWARRARARALLRRADVVLAGSRTLAAELLALGVAAVELPTPIPDHLRDLRRDVEPSRAPTLCWIGQPSTWRYLAEIAPVWVRVRSVHPHARLIVVGGEHAPVAAIPGAESRTWSERAEVEVLSTCDVGLAPLPDDPWTRGKCAARLLAYVAAGVAAVASPVGAQRELVEQVGGALLAATPACFAQAAIELLGDAALRKRLVDEARPRIVAARSCETLLARFRAALSAGARVSVGGGRELVAGPGADG